MDVYLATHHGTGLSGKPCSAVNALAPIVAIVGNSARKGADAARMKTIKASPRIQGVWQLHTTTAAPDVNVEPDMIANPDTDQTKDRFYTCALRIQKSGEITVIQRTQWLQQDLSGQVSSGSTKRPVASFAMGRAHFIASQDSAA